MFIAPLYLNFLRHGKRDTVMVLTKRGDVAFITRLLVAEIIGGATDDHQLIVKILIELLQLLVLWCKTAFRSSVHNEQFLALELRKIDLITFQPLYGKIVNRVFISCFQRMLTGLVLLRQI